MVVLLIPNPIISKAREWGRRASAQLEKFRAHPPNQITKRKNKKEFWGASVNPRSIFYWQPHSFLLENIISENSLASRVKWCKCISLFNLFKCFPV